MDGGPDENPVGPRMRSRSGRVALNEGVLGAASVRTLIQPRHLNPVPRAHGTGRKGHAGLSDRAHPVARHPARAAARRAARPDRTRLRAPARRAPCRVRLRVGARHGRLRPVRPRPDPQRGRGLHLRQVPHPSPAHPLPLDHHRTARVRLWTVPRLRAHRDRRPAHRTAHHPPDPGLKTGGGGRGGDESPGSSP